jgi:DNA-binding LytR/AlgR family response regulator
MSHPEALIADDEKQLRIYLKSKLASLWPELVISGEAENGIQALDLIETRKPGIAFLDIKMPGISGLEVARRITANCIVVFITAYDEFSIEAFENEAIDYLLKPVTDERLVKTIERLKKRLAASPPEPPRQLTETLERLLVRMENQDDPGHLKWIKARLGDEVRLVAVDGIYFFKAEDKYTVVKTRDSEYLIKISIRQLTEELDPDRFWRIHRSTIVNLKCVAGVHRSFGGRLLIKLKDFSETLPVSKTYAHLFKQM